MKTCTKCNKQKELDDFPLRKAGEHARRSHCKSCLNEYIKLYKRGVFFKDLGVDTKPINHTNVVRAARDNLWDRPVYVAPKWGR